MLSKLWTSWRNFRAKKNPRAAAHVHLRATHTRRAPRVEILEDRLAPAAVVTATLDDQTFASVSPGGAIDYKVVISNTGDSNALGVQYTDTVDPTTLVGAVKITPIAVDDAYSVVGNTRFTTPAVLGLLANDLDPDDAAGVGAGRVSVKTGSVSQIGGVNSGSTLTVAPNGSFVYEPGLGATGTERFQYTIVDSDNQDSLTPGFVDFTVGSKVWFVDNSAPDGGDGRQGAPFNSLAPLNNVFNDVDGADDYIYVAKGIGPYSGGLALETGQHLIGAGSSLVVGGKTLVVGNAANTPTLTNDSNYTLALASNNDIHGVAITNSGGVGIAGISGGTLTIGGAAIDGVSINVTGGVALSLAGYSADVTLSGLSSTNSNSVGARIQDVSGSLNLGAGAMLGGVGGFMITTGTANISYAGTIANSAGRSVSIQNKRGGTVTFTGPITGSAGSTGILLTGNTGATINFNGDVNLTTSNDAFTATGGGTINVPAANNSLATTTGIALNVVNTTIGAGGLKFKRISAGTALSGPTSGIVLSNTGSTGSLTISGDGNTTLGGNGTGGTIQHTSSHAISLTNTLNPSLTNLNIRDIARSGIFGTGVTNFTLSNSTIDTVNTIKSATDGNVSFNRSASTDANIAGAVSITGSVLGRSFKNGIDILNNAGTISNLTITGNTLTSSPDITSSQGTAIKVVAGQGGVSAGQIAAGNISGNAIANFPGGGGILVQGGGTAALAPVNIGSLANPLKIEDNTIGGLGAASTDLLGGNGIEVTIGHLSNGYFTIGELGHGNTISNVADIGVAVNLLGAGMLKAAVAYNTIDAHNLEGAPGINAAADAATSNDNTPQLFLDIHHNQVKNTQGEGIFAAVRNTDGTGNFKIENNTVLAPSGAGLKYGIRVDSGNGNEATGAHVVLKIAGNTTAGSTSGAVTNPGIGLRQQHAGVTSTFAIEGLTPSPANDLQMSQYVGNKGQNPGSADGRLGSNGADSISSGATFTAKAVVIPLRAVPTGGVTAGPRLAKGRAPTAAPVGSSGKSAPASAASQVTMSLAPADLNLIVAAARARWSAAGLTAEQLALLQTASFTVSATLPTQFLGVAEAGSVVISANGAGYGWFVDATPFDDAEFPTGAAPRLYSTSQLKPAGHYDLLTTVLHEMGHLLGLSDLAGAANRNDLMFGQITFGERRLPFFGEAIGAIPGAAQGIEFLGAPLTIGTLPAGKSVAISFKIGVPASTGRIVNQGTVTGSNFATVATDDPSTAAVGDATETTVFVFDPLAVNVTVLPKSVIEDGTSNLVFTFIRQSGLTSPLTVNFRYSGSADFGADYTQSGASSFTGGFGTLIIPAFQSTASVTIDPTADITSEPDEDVILTVVPGTNYNVGLNGPAIGAIASDDTDVSVVATTSSALEDGTDDLVFTFTRAGALNRALTVNVNFGGAAALNTDYSVTGADSISATAGTITFAPGSSTAVVVLHPIADKLAEPDETAVLTVAPGSGYRATAPVSATGTFLNDDTNVTIAVSPAAVSEDGAPLLIYTLTRTGGTSSPLSVNITVAGTATFGVDYVASGADSIDGTSGVVTFVPGSATVAVLVNPTADTDIEPDETVILAVTPGQGYESVAPDTATGTISSDDVEVSVTVSPGSVLEDGAANLVYTFTRNGGIAGPLTANFTIAGPATFATDYVASGAATINATSGSVTFAAGSATATVTVDPRVDTTIEEDEFVVITMAPGTGYNVAAPASAAGVITNDDSGVSLAVSPAAVNEGGTGLLAYTFTRSGTAATALTVNFDVSGTASFNTDYIVQGAATITPTSGTVIFAPGSSLTTVFVDPTTDTDG